MLACVKSRTRHGLTLLKSLEEAIEEEIKHEVLDRFVVKLLISFNAKNTL